MKAAEAAFEIPCHVWEGDTDTEMPDAAWPRGAQSWIHCRADHPILLQRSSACKRPGHGIC